MKFEGLYERATQLDCDKIVTGHYARVCHNEETGRYELKKALDATKDQSYVLYALTQDQLAHTEFPLGEYTKVQIRQMAEERGFVNARKKDSQDICFVPDGHYQQFIEQYLGKKLPEGNFVDESGKVLGRHKGIIYYTIGQRKGLGIAAGEPVFVKEIRPDTNEVVIGSNESLFSDTLEAEDFNWISVKEPAPGEEVPCTAKVRYRHTEQPAVARVLENGKVQVVFKEKQRAITKGQAVVLYDGERVLGGGTICVTS
jgi:tRNA-specific 2-thiouridylase